MELPASTPQSPSPRHSLDQVHRASSSTRPSSRSSNPAGRIFKRLSLQNKHVPHPMSAERPSRSATTSPQPPDSPFEPVTTNGTRSIDERSVSHSLPSVKGSGFKHHQRPPQLSKHRVDSAGALTPLCEDAPGLRTVEGVQREAGPKSALATHPGAVAEPSAVNQFDVIAGHIESAFVALR